MQILIIFVLNVAVEGGRKMESKQNTKLEQAKEIERLVMNDRYSVNDAIKIVKEKAISAPTKVSLIAIDNSLSNKTTHSL